MTSLGTEQRIVVAFLGDDHTIQTLQRLAAQPGVDVVAVAFDLSGHRSLTSLHDAALAHGARRCHAFDVREAFAVDVILPVLRAMAPNVTEAIEAQAGRFIAARLAEVATLERAIVYRSDHVGWVPRAVRAVPAGAAVITLQFADGVPVALNGVPLSPVELMESIETITGMAAIDVLALAYADRSEGASAVLLRAENRVCTVVDQAVV